MRDEWDSRPPPAMGRRAVVYREDHKSFGRFILSEQVRDPVEEIARELIMPLAIKNTPRSGGGVRVVKGKVIPHMQDAYKVIREAGTLKVHRARRVMVKVVNTSNHSAAVEFGNKITRPRRPLGRAGAAIGDMSTKEG